MLHSVSHGDKLISLISLVILALVVRTEAKNVPQSTNRNLIQIYELMRAKVRFKMTNSDKDSDKDSSYTNEK